jgi:hypothetical protein
MFLVLVFALLALTAVRGFTLRTALFISFLPHSRLTRYRNMGPGVRARQRDGSEPDADGEGRAAFGRRPVQLAVCR